ncbi:MAG TPA: insulinase family protein [Rhizomicrobium sp.]|nr:insulinase family protein [Rhizomicrobium sp.]
MAVLSRWMFRAFAVYLLAAIPALADTPPSRPWPQAASDLPADGSVRFGTLPNGMRYAIKRNTTPKGAVSLRFRMDVGSLMERDNEEGIAHMLEHMAFRGSTHVADGDTVKMLQSLGLTFGADTNAFTAPTETVYSFDMPKTDVASVDTALMLMREIASELNISQTALDTERNVVLAEARLRDVPLQHLQKSDWSFLYGDRAADALMPIGKESIVAHANAKLVRDFYEAWYRPERATLLIVGDVDPDAIEAKIKSGFSNWQAKAPPRIAVEYKPPPSHPDSVKLFAEQGAQPYLIYTWLRPHDASPDNKANEARDVIRFIALGVLNQRLAVLTHGANPPFVSASASFDPTATVADTTNLVVSYRSGQAAVGLQSAERAWRDIVKNGVRQDEVDQVVAQFRTFFQGNAEAADTTSSPQIINSLLRSVDERSVFTAPSSDLSLYENVVKSLTLDKINTAVKFVFGGSGPLTFVSSTSPLAGGQTTVMKSLAEADRSPLAATAAVALPPWPYADFGKPGTVAATRTVDEFGVTYIRFDNGVLLTVKPTKLHVGQVLIDVRLGRGKFGLARNRVAPLWALGGAFVQGGLGRYSIDDLQKRLADKVWGASLGTSDDAFVLSGQSRPADLDAELQVLGAYLTDPGWTPQAFDQVRTAYAASLEETMSSPAGVLGHEFPGLIHDGDDRWSLPTEDQVSTATLAQTKAVIADALASGPIDITIVGDTTIDQAVHSVAATFGALPDRPAPEVLTKGDEQFPDPTEQPVVLNHRGAANQAIAAIVWPTQGFLRDMKLQRTLRVLSEIFSQRLLDDLRTREGITYTPGASTIASTNSRDYGYLYALAQIPPDKIANFYASADAVAAGLRDQAVSDEVLNRARGPRVEDIQRQQQSNEYWLSLLAGSQVNPHLLDIIRSTIPDLQSVTATDVQKAAHDWLKDDHAWRIVVVPQGVTPPQLTH